MIERSEKSKGHVIVIDDDQAARVSIGQMLRLRSYETEVFASAEAVLALPNLPNIDCVVTDIKMPGMDGEAFLAEVHRRNIPVPVIMISGHGDISMAVRCLKAGAYDFVEKPFDDDVLLASVARAVEKVTLTREREALRKRLNMLAPEEDGRFGMVGRSRIMQDLYEQIEMVAKSNAPVVISGETGVGKELVARAIHQQSSRADGPFVPINAGALPETMLESALFGHAKGAFTGAVTERAGSLITASGGTLLLDEIECISEQAQVQLLRVLEDGLVQSLGEDKPRKVDVRLLVTTNVNLKEKLGKGQIREDFYHRIAVLGIRAPRLAERTDDIILLVSHFLKQAADRHGIAVPEISEKTLRNMLRYAWPGNVRELKHVVERMVVTCHDGVVSQFTPDEDEIPGRLLSLPATQGRLREELERTERQVIEACLREHGGEVSVVAQALGISRRALYERLKKYEIFRTDFQR